MNNYTLNTADRLTHLKIVAVSLVAGIVVVGVGIAARPDLPDMVALLVMWTEFNSNVATAATFMCDPGKPQPKRHCYDTGIPGNGNGGHVYGTSLADGEKRAIVEYMKTF